MKTVVRLALVDPHDNTRSSLKSLMLGIDTVWLEAECSRYDFFFDVVMQTRPDIALVALDSDATKGLAWSPRSRRSFPTCNVLVDQLVHRGQPDPAGHALAQGKEFLSLPLKLEDVLSALERIRQNSRCRVPGEGQVRACHVIPWSRALAALGCTSLAVNVGCYSRPPASRDSVVVIDLDFAARGFGRLARHHPRLHNSGCRRKHHAA